MSPNYREWGGGVTYCLWEGSGVRSTSCPLCNLNTLWNILMTLCRNVDQDEMMCHIQDWQLWLSYFWSSSPLFYLKDFVSSVIWMPVGFNDTWLKCRTGSDDRVVGWCEGVLYLTSPGRPTDIGLQLGKACYPCSRWGGCFYFFCFFTFIPVPLSSLSLSFISSTISFIFFLPFSGRQHKMTHKGWRVVKPQLNQSDDVSHTRMTTLPFLRLPLSPIVIFDSDNPLIGVRSVGQRLFGRFLLFLVEM